MSDDPVRAMFVRSGREGIRFWLKVGDDHWAKGNKEFAAKRWRHAGRDFRFLLDIDKFLAEKQEEGASPCTITST